MPESSVARKKCRQSDDIRTPHGLLIGKRRKRNGETVIDYMSRGKHETMTVKEIVECIEGIKLERVEYVHAENNQPN